MPPVTPPDRDQAVEPALAPTEASGRRGWALWRLAALIAVLISLAVIGSQWVDVTELRRDVEQLGPLAGPGWVLVSGVLGALLVPGPVLGTAAGALFGPVTGALLNLAAALLTSVLATTAGRVLGRDALRSAAGAQRVDRIRTVGPGWGVLLVVGQRLLPFVPDAPSTYAFGALGLRSWQVLAGTVLGSAPWAVGYALLGAGLGRPTAAVELAGGGVLLAAGLAGLVLGRRVRTAVSADRAGPVATAGTSRAQRRTSPAQPRDSAAGPTAAGRGAAARCSRA